MSTNQPQTQAADLEAFLADPLSMPADVDLEALSAGEAGAADSQENPNPDGAPEGSQPAAGNDAATNEQGETNGDAPGTGKDAKEEGKQDQPNAGQDNVPAGQEQPAGVASRDGKHIIPYTELSTTRERALRAEAMLEQVMAENAALKSGNSAGAAGAVEVDEETLSALREDSPETASLVEKLINANRQLSESAKANAQAEAQDQVEQRVQQQVSTEDAIAAIPKLVHVRTNDRAAYTEIAQIDTTLAGQPRWQGKSLQERFEAAVRMYEAVNGDIALPGQKQAQPNTPASQQQPANTAARVDAAIAKAQAADAGPSTLSDIPGGEPAANSHQDALAQLSEAAILDRFMSMSPDQIEAELARLS